MNDDILEENEYAASAVRKIRSEYSIEKEMQLEAKLKQLSVENAIREGRPEAEGTINRKDFEYLLKSEFKLTGREIQNLLELITPSFDEKINFKSFFSFLRKGENFEDSFRRENNEESDEGELENTLRRDTAEFNIHGMLKEKFSKEDIVRLLPTKLNEYDKEYLREKIDYLNVKSGMEGYISYDDLLIAFVKSDINLSNDEIKSFLDGVPKEGKRLSNYSGVEEVTFEVDYPTIRG
eukprot:CAMPEP_0205804428 /NCGR_PEP_ID=MMETSP0205-20121125/7335_1 /ASSEMBLY_ACC=CAM_ASM_000278 /TAXON_ID=36767 /ORGANISM="Euplotes focardii, Strain TN1" /LENGTH=236 /DNA_ID=CAMNT_0053074003 /DNA_START=336 /DNA_END=1046 /DNA_ORIENTATION=-